MNCNRPAFAAIYLVLVTQSAVAHEFWLEREAPISTNHYKVSGHQGEGLDGTPFAMSPNPESHWWTDATGLVPVQLISYLPDGSVELIVDEPQDVMQIAYQSGPSLQRHADFTSFRDFVTDEGLPAIADEHFARGLPRENFFEVFYRHTQLLRCLDKGTSENALTLPYQWRVTRAKNQDQSTSATLWEFQLLVDEAPLPVQPVHVFSASANEAPVLVRKRTDGDGNLSLSIEPDSKYVISTTILKTPERKVMVDTAAIWESRWVSLRFDSPDACTS